MQCRVQEDEGTQVSAEFGCFRQCDSSVTGAVGAVSPGVCWGGVCSLFACPGLVHLKLFQRHQRGKLGLKHVSGFLYCFISDFQTEVMLSKQDCN